MKIRLSNQKGSELLEYLIVTAGVGVAAMVIIKAFGTGLITELTAINALLAALVA